MNYLKETDRKNLILRRKGDARYLRGQKKIAKRNLLERPQRSIDTWNGLKKVMIMAKNVLHQLTEKLFKYRYGDRTTRV